MLPTITIIGGVDSGKSTLIGNLLMETKSLPNGLIQKVKDLCEKEKLVFEPAFLVDYLREEAETKSTRERALAELKVGKEKILIIDTPGQTMLSRKMISGLSEANVVIILIDMADKDIKKYYYYLKLASLLGFSKMIVAVNKLDLFDYKKEEYENFLKKAGIKKGKNFFVMPISALKNQNLIKRSKLLAWHKGDNLLKALRKILAGEKEKKEKNFLMPVQSVFKNLKKKIAFGLVLAGSAAIGEKIKVFDGEENRKIKIKELYHNNKAVKKIFAGENAGIVVDLLERKIKRGDIFNNFKKKDFFNKFDAGIYVLEPFLLNNLRDYNVRLLKGDYGIKKLKIKKRFDFQLAGRRHDNQKFLANEFLDVQMVLDKKLLNIKDVRAKRLVIENKEKRVVAIGVIS